MVSVAVTSDWSGSSSGGTSTRLHATSLAVTVTETGVLDRGPRRISYGSESGVGQVWVYQFGERVGVQAAQVGGVAEDLGQYLSAVGVGGQLDLDHHRPSAGHFDGDQVGVTGPAADLTTQHR
jgi:hypothetical protein